MNCPICFEELQMTNNMITTECGHQFHASCLMKHAVYNGFSCPCCRTIMAEKENKKQNTGGEDSDDETYDESDDDNTNSDTDSIDSINSSDYDDTVISEQMNIYQNEYLLRGFRFFMNRIDCIEDSEEDIEEEKEDEESESPLPSPEYLIRDLQDENVTLEQMVTALLLAYHTEYKNYIRDLDSESIIKSNVVMYKMNRLIYNYNNNNNNNNNESTDDIYYD